MGRWGLNVVVATSDALASSAVGLLGPAGEGDLPALPDGSAVTVGDDLRAPIYDVLAPAWAVTLENSLFDYDAGQGPQTFRDPSVPTASAASFSALPPRSSRRASPRARPLRTTRSAAVRLRRRSDGRHRLRGRIRRRKALPPRASWQSLRARLMERQNRCPARMSAPR
jgi:hypothetical protein